MLHCRKDQGQLSQGAIATLAFMYKRKIPNSDFYTEHAHAKLLHATWATEILIQISNFAEENHAFKHESTQVPPM